MTSPFHGIERSMGAAALRQQVSKVWWYDRSPFISDPCVGIVPSLRYEFRPYRDPAGQGGDEAQRVDAAADARRVGVAFAPEHGRGAVSWAARKRLHLLAADRNATGVAGDKISSLALFKDARVAVPECFVVPEAGRKSTAEYWIRACWPSAVVQRRHNNLIGRGTRLVSSCEELSECLSAWSGESLKVSRHIGGLTLTVSGCVGPDRTVVSAVSHQLVGLPELVDAWGGHCGNQTVGRDQIPTVLLERCQESCQRVGDRLRSMGYRGAFGLDLVSDGDRVLAIEINPRFQTVVGLVQAAEMAAGWLPMLGLHVLSFLVDKLPVPCAAPVSATPLSQIVVHARRAGRLRAAVGTGCYRLTRGELRPIARRPLSALGPEEASVWRHAQLGSRIEEGEEVALVQFSGHVAELSPRPPLGARGLAWVDAIGALTVIDG